MVLGEISPEGAERLGNEDGHSPQSSAKFKNGGGIPPLRHVFTLIKHSDNFSFTKCLTISKCSSNTFAINVAVAFTYSFSKAFKWHINSTYNIIRIYNKTKPIYQSHMTNCTCTFCVLQWRNKFMIFLKKGKAIPVTGREGT
jgi:hypothetical protein